MFFYCLMYDFIYEYRRITATFCSSAPPTVIRRDNTPIFTPMQTNLLLNKAVVKRKDVPTYNTKNEKRKIGAQIALRK